MKKQLSALLFLTIGFLQILTPTAQADILIEPHNDFYYRHRQECQRVDRNFITNGERGFVSLKAEPGSQDEVIQISNGQILYIILTYNQQGKIWAATEVHSPDDPNNPWLNGWIPLEDLLLEYDYISFAEDHQNEIYLFDHDSYYDKLPTNGDLVFWSWPGSGKLAWLLEEDWRSSDSEEYWLQPSQGYTDSSGRQWGFFAYIYGVKNIWACLNDPTNKDIPAFNPAPEPQLKQPSETDIQPADTVDLLDNSGLLKLIIILIAALAVVTATLIHILWKPQKVKFK